MFTKFIVVSAGYTALSLFILINLLMAIKYIESPQMNFYSTIITLTLTAISSISSLGFYFYFRRPEVKVLKLVPLFLIAALLLYEFIRVGLNFIDIVSIVKVSLLIVYVGNVVFLDHSLKSGKVKG